mgnify:CR=1 FL=1
MAANSLIVKLKLSGTVLKDFDFPEKPKKRKRPVKKEDDSGEAKGSNSNNGTSNNSVENGSNGSASAPGNNNNNAYNNTGIITNGGADPMLGGLPRSVKAAPVPNTAGLVINKTPCRKWVKKPIEWKTFTGYSYSVQAWSSTYTEKEWLDKLASEKIQSNESTDKKKSKAPATKKGDKNIKSEPVNTTGDNLPAVEKQAISEQQPNTTIIDSERLKSEPESGWDVGSELASEHQGSELPSDLPSEDNDRVVA